MNYFDAHSLTSLATANRRYTTIIDRTHDTTHWNIRDATRDAPSELIPANDWFIVVCHDYDDVDNMREAHDNIAAYPILFWAIYCAISDSAVLDCHRAMTCSNMSYSYRTDCIIALPVLHDSDGDCLTICDDHAKYATWNDTGCGALWYAPNSTCEKIEAEIIEARRR